MPYLSTADEATAVLVAKFLLSLALRPWETEDTDEDEDVAEATSATDDAPALRMDRKAIWEHYGAEMPVDRWEDFYKALDILAASEAYITLHGAKTFAAVSIVKAAGRRVHVVISRNVHRFLPAFVTDDGYDPDDLFDDYAARELLEDQGFDLETFVPDAHRIMPPPRAGRVAHDPSAPRTCSRCKVTKATDQFSRRGAPGTPRHGQFQSQCNDCRGDHFKEWRKANPDERTRPERVKTYPRKNWEDWRQHHASLRGANRNEPTQFEARGYGAMGHN